MYMRIYNNKLIKVFTGDDLNSSEIISTLKGRTSAGFTFRDKDKNIVFYDVDKISAKELQLLIRKAKTATVAIELNEDEVIDYFYMVAKVQLVEHNVKECSLEELFTWMNSSIDSGILNSVVWKSSKSKVINKLLEDGIVVNSKKHNRSEQLKFWFF